MLLRNIRAGRFKRHLLDLGLSYQNRGFRSRKPAFLGPFRPGAFLPSYPDRWSASLGTLLMVKIALAGMADSW